MLTRPQPTSAPDNDRPVRYYQLIWQKVRRDVLARWSLRILGVLIFIAVFGEFLANDRPLVCRLDGQVYFPVVRKIGHAAGVADYDTIFADAYALRDSLSFAIWPPVPYSATTPLGSRMFRAPLEGEPTESWFWQHWLGTDQVGRDVLAGMITGTRTAMLVGVVSMSVAALLGLFFGGIAGYFGDHRWRLRWSALLGGLSGFLLGLFWAFAARAHAWTTGWMLVQLLISVLLIGGLTLGLAWLSGFLPFGKKQVRVPIDFLVMRLIELINSVPALLLLLAIVGMLDTSSLLMVMLVIGLLRWTTIARFVRSELLRIRSLPYVAAAKTMGLSDRLVLLRHALPNALQPAMIALAFGMASSILLEAFLSFLGIGMPADTITWGTLLRGSRAHADAWWLAVFPGMAIFVTVTIFNIIGEALSEATG